MCGLKTLLAESQATEIRAGRAAWVKYRRAIVWSLAVRGHSVRNTAEWMQERGLPVSKSTVQRDIEHLSALLDEETRQAEARQEAAHEKCRDLFVNHGGSLNSLYSEALDEYSRRNSPEAVLDRFEDFPLGLENE